MADTEEYAGRHGDEIAAAGNDPEDVVRGMLDQGNPASWNFEEDGADVIGYALRKEKAMTQEGPCDILVLNVKHADGMYYERSVWLFHTALISQLERKRPKVGDLVGIRFLGERQSKTPGGRPYKDYNVVVHGTQGGALDWDDSARVALPAGAPEEVQGEWVDPTPPATGQYPDPSADWSGPPASRGRGSDWQ